MKKKTILLMFAALSLFSFSTSTFAATPDGPDKIFPGHALVLQVSIDLTKGNVTHPKSPVLIPNVYFDSSTSMLYFENPCYECTLELVIPGTDTTVYTYSIPDGDDTVQLPSNLSGTYELHIHRGNYCFFGEIEL